MGRLLVFLPQINGFGYTPTHRLYLYAANSSVIPAPGLPPSLPSPLTNAPYPRALAVLPDRLPTRAPSHSETQQGHSFAGRNSPPAMDWRRSRPFRHSTTKESNTIAACIRRTPLLSIRAALGRILCVSSLNENVSEALGGQPTSTLAATGLGKAVPRRRAGRNPPGGRADRRAAASSPPCPSSS